MRYTFIMNPAAGRIGRKERKRGLEQALKASGIPYCLLETAGRRHAVALARESAQSGDVLVAVGGDGTVHEVVSGIMESGTDAQLGVLPWGSGNDFARMFDVPVEASRAIETLRSCRPTRVDLGRVTWEGPDGAGGAVFVNVAGAGIDAKVAAAAGRFKWLKGTPRYLAAVLHTLKAWTAPEVEVTFDLFRKHGPAANHERRSRLPDHRHGSSTRRPERGERHRQFPERRYADLAVASTEPAGGGSAILRAKILLVIVGNGRSAAGGFYLVPDARVDDGALDTCIVRSASIPRIISLIPAVLHGGRHTDAPEVVMGRGRKIIVRSGEPLPVQADGEILVEAATRVTFEVIEGGLAVRMPVKR